MFYPAVWWIVTAVVFFILEIATASFFFLWIGAGAVVTAILSLFVGTEWIQYTTFAVSSIVLVAVSRRWAHVLTGKTGRLSNVDALVGQTAVVTKVFQDNNWQGYVKVNGEMWRVETENKEPLEKNAQVTVVSARSNVLVVEAL
jgi:membrane protein implicated in regulation of membrane protease activity